MFFLEQAVPFELIVLAMSEKPEPLVRYVKEGEEERARVFCENNPYTRYVRNPEGLRDYVVLEAPSEMTCYKCGRTYMETRSRVREWAESGQPYEPTDWVCWECRKL